MEKRTSQRPSILQRRRPLRGPLFYGGDDLSEVFCSIEKITSQRPSILCRRITLRGPLFYGEDDLSDAFHSMEKNNSQKTTILWWRRSLRVLLFYREEDFYKAFHFIEKQISQMQYILQRGRPLKRALRGFVCTQRYSLSLFYKRPPRTSEIHFLYRPFFIVPIAFQCQICFSHSGTFLLRKLMITKPPANVLHFNVRLFACLPVSQSLPAIFLFSVLVVCRPNVSYMAHFLRKIPRTVYLP